MTTAINVRNVNGALASASVLLRELGVVQSSRVGFVRVLEHPVVTTYRRPVERVLLSPERRANPFFHLFEAFWMLSGSRDARWLDRYVHDYSFRFAGSDGEQHGAYGHRWRNFFGRDQLDWAVGTLTDDPDSRRVVIGMWDPESDAWDLSDRALKDVPCNTHIYLRLQPQQSTVPQRRLDMTVLCRSNDAVWGAYGANAVHFSVLLEYLAWRLGATPGYLHQFSNNLHVYDSTAHLLPTNLPDPYESGEVIAEPLFTDDIDDRDFLDMLAGWTDDPSDRVGAAEEGAPTPFGGLLIPMSRVHDAIVNKDLQAALALCQQVQPTDWRAAAVLYVKQRMGTP